MILSFFALLSQKADVLTLVVIVNDCETCYTGCRAHRGQTCAHFVANLLENRHV
jgi:hypothetical protein